MFKYLSASQVINRRNSCRDSRTFSMQRHIQCPGAAIAAAATFLLLASALPRVNGAGLAANNTKSILYLKSTLNVRNRHTLGACCLPTA